MEVTSIPCYITTEKPIEKSDIVEIKKLLAEIASGIKKTNEHLEADLKIKLSLLSSPSLPAEKNQTEFVILNGLDSKQMEQYFEKTREGLSP